MSNVLVQENVFEVEVTCGETVVVTMPGATGERGTIDIGTTSTVNPDQPAAVENVGTLNDATLNFAIPRGSHVSVGTTSPTTYSTDNPAVSDSGTNGDVVLDFTLPRAPTISVGTTSNVDYGTPAEVVNSGTNGDVVLDFTLQSGPLAKVTELRGRTTLGGATGTVAINITDFNASFDLLHVYINSTYIAQGSDYTISGTNIVKFSGTWATGTIIDFVCFRSILIPAETLPEAIGDLPIPDPGNFYPIDTIGEAFQEVGSQLAHIGNPNLGTMTNLITNADFELDTNSDGLADGWQISAQASAVFSMESISPLFGAKSQKTVSEGYGNICQSIASVSGHIYYWALRVLLDTGSAIVVGLSDNVFISGPSNVAAGTMQNVSGIITAAGTTIFLCQTFNAGSVCTVIIDNAVVIDLTGIFGSGNEPDASFIDKLMEQYENEWFDGTQTLTLTDYLLSQVRFLQAQIDAYHP